ncbi:MAG: hypothetical protein JWM37_642 [Candidatus Saccharibacteria bacterium]|nr:hypothetical protein [Candidatus Saccharibacteria bacterium]
MSEFDRVPTGPLDDEAIAASIEATKHEAIDLLSDGFDQPLRADTEQIAGGIAETTLAYRFVQTLLDQKKPTAAVDMRNAADIGTAREFGGTAALLHAAARPFKPGARKRHNYIDEPVHLKTVIEPLSGIFVGLMSVEALDETKTLEHEGADLMAERYGVKPRYEARLFKRRLDDKYRRDVNGLLLEKSVGGPELWESVLSAYDDMESLHEAIILGKIAVMAAEIIEQPKFIRQLVGAQRRAAESYAMTGRYDTARLRDLQQNIDWHIDRAVSLATPAKREEIIEDAESIASFRQSVLVHREQVELTVGRWQTRHGVREEIAIDDKPVLPTPPVERETQTEPTPVVEREPEEPAVNEALIEAQADYETALSGYQEFMQPFRPSNRTLKRLGLQGAQRDLLVGYRIGNEQLTNGMLDTDVQRLLGNLAGMDAATTGLAPEDRRQKLSELLTTEEALLHEIESARQRLRNEGKNGFTPVRADLHDTNEWLTDNRDELTLLLLEKLEPARAEYYARLVDELWPHDPEHAMAESIAVELEENPTIEPLAEIDEPEAVPLPEPIEPTEPEMPELPDFAEAPLLPEPQLEKNIAHQLDWELFPADASLETVRTAVMNSLTPEQAADVDWSRIRNLYEIQQGFGGELYRGKPKTLGADMPYFVAIVDIDGEQFAVAENPTWGNATYVLRTSLAEYGASWQEVFQESRLFARILGAEPVVHTRTSNQLNRIMDKVQDLLLVKPVTSAAK